MAETEQRSNYLKAYILLMYYIVVGLLAVVGNISADADMKPILSMLTPHLLYIPMVLKLENHMVLLRLILIPKEDMMMQIHRVTMYR